MSILIIVGAIALGMILWRPLSVIPIAFACYFAAAAIVPNYLGYPVSYQYVLGKEAYVLGGVGNQYLLVILENENIPRLIQVEPSEQAQIAIDKSKEGVSIIRFGSQEENANSGNGDSQGGGSTTVELVEPKDSKLMGK